MDEENGESTEQEVMCRYRGGWKRRTGMKLTKIHRKLIPETR